MSATIYSIPEELEPKIPDFNFSKETYQEYSKRVDDFYDLLRQWLKENGFKGKNAGEIVSMPIADGKANYMVIKSRPLELFHIPIGDAWHHPMADLLTAKRVDEMIRAEKAMQKLFASRS